MTPKVPTSDNGTDRLGMIVAATLRRNTKMTRTTNTTANTNSSSTSATEARMVTVRSVRTAISTAAGIAARREGSNSWMLLTTAMTLAPGWRCTLIMTAGSRFVQAPSLVFSELSTISATSLIFSGAPFLYASSRLLYSAADFSLLLALIVYARVGPSKFPFGVLMLAL